MAVSKLQKALESGAFVITGEVGPPKGVDLHHVKEGVKMMKDKVVAINVTDIQTAVMRVGSMAVSHTIVEMGAEPVFQMVCRDRNRLALQSDVLSAYTLGIRNILCLTGDHILMGDHHEAMPVYDLDSVSLLRAISNLESGHDLGKDMKGNVNQLDGDPPKLFKGCCVTPCSEVVEPQILKLRKKVEAGAQFVQTQAVYDPNAFEKFMNQIQDVKIPILVGIVLLKSAGMARYMNSFVPGVVVPKDLMDRFEGLTAEEDCKKVAIDIAAELIQKMKPMCQGAHIMPLGWDDCIAPIVDRVNA